MSSPPTLANQDVVNAFYDVAAAVGLDGWQLVAKAGWEWLVDPPESRSAPFDRSHLAVKPATLTEAEWQALTSTIGALSPSGPSRTRRVTNQQVVNVFHELAPQFGLEGWAFVTKAGWEWLAQPSEARNDVFSPSRLATRPSTLAGDEWQAVSESVTVLLSWPTKSEVVEAPPEVAPHVEEDNRWPEWWPWRRALVGLHGRGDGLNRDLDFQRFRLARIESAKFLSRAGSEAEGHVREAHTARARSEMTFGPTPIVLRPMYNFPTKEPVSPEMFVRGVERHVRAFGAQGDVLWLVEIHNEPNVFFEGFGGTWKNGQQFANWWLATRELLRPMMPPQTRWGYPGLSPGGPSQYRGAGERQFFEESKAAWRAADWVAAHSYWQTRAQMADPNFGWSWKWIQERSGKPVAITEFANTHVGTPKAEKARQYVEYYRALRNEPGVLAAYCFIVSVSGDEWPEQKWDEQVAKIVGARDF